MNETKFTGTIISVGSDETGQPRALIHSTVDRIHGRSSPIYRQTEITIRWPVDPLTPESSSPADQP